MKTKEFKAMLVKHKDDYVKKFEAPKNAMIMRVYLKHREYPFLALLENVDWQNVPDVSDLMTGTVAHFEVLGTLTDHAVFVPLCGTDPVDDRDVVVKEIRIAPQFVESIEFLAKFGG